MDSIVVGLKGKESFGHVMQGQENGKPFSPGAGRLTYFNSW